MLICLFAVKFAYFQRSGKRSLAGIGTRRTSITHSPQTANLRTAVAQHRTQRTDHRTGPHSSRAFGVWVSSVRVMSGAGQCSSDERLRMLSARRWNIGTTKEVSFVCCKSRLL